MGLRVLFFLCITTTALVCVSSRAVNISNTWMLPEEGFPVFYRYFRDRISWYEADAVCQFHHANLVTVDTTSEFDAVRAYLKELDIVNNVWIGLSNNGDKSKFTWPNFRPLSNEGYWQEAIPVGTNPLCAVADPAADYRWHALPCGGPEVAAFICELPVPIWATGSTGCLLTEIPSLTVLYVPEESAIELTSDCGLDGTKRISCKGNADRDEMIKQLACAITNEDDDDKTTKLPHAEEITTPILQTTKHWTSNTIESEDYGAPTRHRRETENTLSPSASTISTLDLERRVKGATTDSPVTTPVSNLNDVTLDLSVTQRPFKPKITTTSQENSITYKSSSHSKDQVEMLVTTTTPRESEQDDKAEYLAVINQGHLFSVLENGTMFDIIELNETETEDLTIMSTKPETTTPEYSINSLYTTIIYHKEPTEVITKADKNGENEEFKQEVTPIFKQEYNDKNLKRPKTRNDLLNEDDDRALTKEIETLPILPDTSTTLNRTGRKKLPSEHHQDDFVIVDENASHKIVEIKLHKEDNNSTHPQLFITTRITDKTKKIEKQPKTKKKEALKPTSTTATTENNTQQITNSQNNEFDSTSDLETEVAEIEIDPKIDILNSENVTKNSDSESITHLKKQLLPKSLQDSDPESNNSNEVVADDPQEIGSTVAPTGEPLDVVPQQQPKPSRQRLISKPQRRSFYPYFFSRVLG